MNILQDIVKKQKEGIPAGIYSCCSANEFVLRAVLRKAADCNTCALIEATANQVNQDGGYTGMTPAQFSRYVRKLAEEEGLKKEQLILGGDHLGPLVWAGLPEREAMKKAKELVRQYVQAGCIKIHIDTSMKLKDDTLEECLDERVIARRGTELIEAAEEAFREYGGKDPCQSLPSYVIGSEVPVPGGVKKEENMRITAPEDCVRTLGFFRSRMKEQGMEEVWKRVIAIVVQPGVEFSGHEICEYNREKAQELTSVMKNYPGIVLEGHSTDYQTPEHLKEMVEDGIAFLKVGPALTFSLREGIFALEGIEKELFAAGERSYVRETLDEVMAEKPDYWRQYYRGSEREIRNARAFSLSDRCRYYFQMPDVVNAVNKLLDNLQKDVIPYSLLSQYLPVQYRKVREGIVVNTGYELLLDYIGERCDEYLYAAGIKEKRRAL